MDLFFFRWKFESVLIDEIYQSCDPVISIDLSPMCGAQTSQGTVSFFWHLNEADTLSHDFHAVLNVNPLILCQLSHYLWYGLPSHNDRVISCARSSPALIGWNSFPSLTKPVLPLKETSIFSPLNVSWGSQRIFTLIYSFLVLFWSFVWVMFYLIYCSLNLDVSGLLNRIFHSC